MSQATMRPGKPIASRLARVLALAAASAVALAGGPAWSYETKDLTELHETNACRDCALSGAPLGKADLAGAELAGADLFAAVLNGANLSRSNLTEANLMGANLGRANLSEANLTGAQLDGASLTRANLFGATLLRADVNNAVLRRALFCNTTMPDGTTNDRGCN